MKRICISFIVGTLCCLTLQASAQVVTLKPPYERLLQGEDAKQAEKLDEQIIEFEAANDFAAAIRTAEKLLSLRRMLQGADHWEVADQQHMITALQKVAALSPEQRAGWRKAFQGAIEASELEGTRRFANAEPLLQEYRRWCEKVFGEKHPHTATSYNNLAANFAAQGKNVDAQPLYQKALDLRREVLGEKHPHTALSYGNLAKAFDGQLKYADAQPLYQKALDLRRELLGEHHSSTAVIYNSLATNLYSRGKYTEAQPVYQKALDLRREMLGEKHPSTAISYNNLAVNLFAQGRYTEAQPLYQRTLKLNIELFGAKHSGTATSYNNLGITLDAQGKHTEAQQLHQKALELNRELLGEKHPDTAASYNNLAVNMSSQGKHADVEPLLQKAHDINRAVLGEQHPNTARSYLNLANNLYAQAKYADAQPVYQKALDLGREWLGEQHPDTASFYRRFADNLRAQGRFAEAQPLYQKALDLNRKALGEQHPATATSYNYLAYNLYYQQKYAAAEEVLEQSIHSYEASRLTGASGLNRATLGTGDPRCLLAVLRARSEPAVAWALAEMTLARGLLDEQGASNITWLTAAELADQIQWRSELASTQARILYFVTKFQRTDSETEKLEDLLNQRRQTEQRLAVLSVRASQREVSPPEAIRAALPSDAALIFWIDSNSDQMQEHWGCIVRSSGEPKWERLPGTGPDNRWTQADIELPAKLRAALPGNLSASETSNLSRQLHAQRLAPLAKYLAGVKALYVVPVNVMAGVPVEALTNEYTISYIPSGTFLARLKDLAKPNGITLLALADPIFTRPGDQSELVVALPPSGLLITQVERGGAADQARLKTGDVLLKYGDTELTVVDKLKDAVAANAAAKTIPVTVWRENAEKSFIRDIAPGKLGVVLDKDPAPVASPTAVRATRCSSPFAAETGGTSLERGSRRAGLDNCLEQMRRCWSTVPRVSKSWRPFAGRVN